MAADEDMVAVAAEIGAGATRGGAAMTGTEGEAEEGGAGPGPGVPAGQGPGAGETGGAGAQRGTAGGRLPQRGAAAPRSARSPPRLHLGGKRGEAGAGAKWHSLTSSGAQTLRLSHARAQSADTMLQSAHFL